MAEDWYRDRTRELQGLMDNSLGRQQQAQPGTQIDQQGSAVAPSRPPRTPTPSRRDFTPHEMRWWETVNALKDTYQRGGLPAAVGQAVGTAIAAPLYEGWSNVTLPILRGMGRAAKGVVGGYTDEGGYTNAVTQQPAQQQATGGATNAAQQPAANPQLAQQPATNPKPAAAGTGFTAETWGGDNVQAKRDPITGKLTEFRTEALAGSGPNTGWGKVVGPAASQQRSGYGYDPEQARLATTAMQRYGNIIRLGGESDRDFNPNSQVSIGGRGSLNPGYTFIGSAGDAARFFQPVPHGGGYNPYRRPIRTLFDEMGDARMAARATPQPAEQGPMGWKRLRDQMNNESRERIAEMTGGFGLTQAGLQDARAREQLAQQYGINMAQLGNDNLRTQAALGLSGLQQQGQQLQNAQSREQMAAYQRWRNAPPGSPEQAQAAQEMQMLRGGGTSGNDGGYGFQVIKVDNGDGSQSEALVRTNSRTGDASRVPLNQEQGGEIDFMPNEDQEKAILAQMSDADKARYEKAKKAGRDQLREFWRLYARISTM